MDKFLFEQLAILSYIFYINSNQYMIDAFIWGGVNLLEKFMDSLR